ncbi:Hypothetical protein BN117_0486 [Bordetella parapertussis Bpp5]|uniref:Uncharacterized protein n=1 Tax=Bordetella parapertussis (strain Bpp5) TaxID=1208660 RepID=K0MAY9_BORPB|nr:Hypothetical protein BN117_0486 [Bordetella parapertussis Bpp5]
MNTTPCHRRSHGITGRPVLGPAVLTPWYWPALQRASGARLDKDKYVIIRARSPQAIFGLSASPAAISVFGGQNSRGPPGLTIGRPLSAKLRRYGCLAASAAVVTSAWSA